MATSPFVHRAHVQAGGAADALQRFTANSIRQRVCASIVNEHNVEVLRPVALSRARPQTRVGVHPLASGGPGKQLQEHLEVLERRQEFFNPHDGDQGFRQGQAHAAIALRLDDGQGARLCDTEVSARNGDLRIHKLLAQEESRCLGQVCGIIRQAFIRVGHLLNEDVPDLSAVTVNRRDHDV